MSHSPILFLLHWKRVSWGDKQQLNSYLAQWMQKGEFNFFLVEPRQLIKSTKEIEQKFGELANKQPDKNTILNAVEKLEREGVNSLSRREWRHIAWGLCWNFPQRPQKLVFLAAGAQYLNVLSSKDKEFICRLVIFLWIRTSLLKVIRIS